jgi:DNA-binding NarL/FixJ family response regulator
MTTTTRPDEDDLLAHVFRDGEKALRILRLLRRGWPMERIIAIGRHERSWDCRYIFRVLQSNMLPTYEIERFLPRVEQDPPRPVPLTLLQRRILDLLCKGMSTSLIGEALDGISDASIRHQIRSITKKMGADDRAQVVAWVLTEQVRPVEASE